MRTHINQPVLRLQFEPLEEGGFVATSSDVPGLVVEARTIDEAILIAYSVAQELAQSYREHGDPLPPVLKAF